MNYKLKKILTNWKVLLLVFCIFMAFFAINPSFNSTGVAITFVERNSSANLAGVSSPPEGASPRSKEVITSIQGRKINNMDDYYEIMEDVKLLTANDTVSITTNKQRQGYTLDLQPVIEIEITDELENITFNETEEIYNEASETWVNVTTTKTEQRNKTVEHIVGVKELGIKVRHTPTSNIRKGLDLEGGTRVILQPNASTSDEVFDDIILNMKQRLNVYGLSDIVVRSSTDLLGTKFILVEIAGVNEDEVKDLISKQGVFEAKIGNETIFSGGSGDIRSVVRDPYQAGIDPRAGCGPLQDGTTICRFSFPIVLSPEAAARQAEITNKLDVVTVSEEGNPLQAEDYYLSQKLDFYLDGSITDSLNINYGLKGKAATDIVISGSRTGQNEPEAKTNALKEMKRMQTILITGQLPVKLKIVKTDAISPVLGKEFLNNALLIGLLALIAIVVIMFVRYRRWEIVVPVIVTMSSELLLLLGFAAAAGWNLDLAAIAGVVIVIGTGVDHLIIITDETLRKTTEDLNWFQRIKRAFSIIIVAGLTTIGAMLPLMAAGAGLLKGFALTTIVGVLIGILIARPAFSAMTEVLLRD